MVDTLFCPGGLDARADQLDAVLLEDTLGEASAPS